MRVSVGRLGRVAFAPVLLALLVLGSGCKSTTSPLFTVSGPGWHVQQGQALWQPRRGFPEVAGDLVLARHGDGRCFVEFAKTPMSMVSAQTTRTNWLVQFPVANRSFGGRGRRSTRFAWLYLDQALAGERLPSGLRFERKADGGWRLENKRSGETVEGVLEP